MNDPFEPKPVVLQGDKTEGSVQTEGQVALFKEEKGGALLEVTLPALKGQIEFQGKKFVLKPEFHVTLVGFAAKLDKKAKEAAMTRGEAMSNTQAGEQVKQALVKAAEGRTFKVSFLPETRRAKKGEFETIIKMCQVEGLSEYLHAVEAELGLAQGSIELPPTHTTVYTLENGQGIGVSNQAQLNELTTPLMEDEVEELRKAVKPE